MNLVHGLGLVLEVHLPFVPHRQGVPAAHERWLTALVIDSLIPLVGVVQALVRDGVAVPLTVAMSLPVMAMLDTPAHRDLIEDMLHECVAWFEGEGHRAQAPTARDRYLAWAGLYRDRLAVYTACGRDLTGALVSLASRSSLDLIPSVGGHGALPLMAEASWRSLAVRAALDTFGRRTGIAPDGVWLPACACDANTAETLAQCGVRYAFVTQTAIAQGSARPAPPAAQPVITSGGVVLFGVARESLEDFVFNPVYLHATSDASQVPLALRRPAPIHSEERAGLPPAGMVEAGYEVGYDPEVALSMVRQHARAFLDLRKRQAATRHERSERLEAQQATPHWISAYPAETFGGRWFEGVAFIDQLCRALGQDAEFVASSPCDTLVADRAYQVVTPATGSWLDDGQFGALMRPAARWIYRDTHALEGRCLALIAQAQAVPLGDDRREALEAAVGLLLLAQDTTWAHIIGSQAGDVGYATDRVRGLVAACTRQLDFVAGVVDKAGPPLPEAEVFGPVGLDAIPGLNG